MIIVCGTNSSYHFGIESNNKDEYSSPIISPPVNLNIDVSSISSFSTYFKHTVIITKEGDILVAGSNYSGEIMNFSSITKIQYYKTFQKIDLIDNSNHKMYPISAVCGSRYTLYLVSESKYSNQRKLIYSSYDVPFPVYASINIGESNPISLFGGNDNSAVINEDGSFILIIDYVIKISYKKTFPASKLPNGEKAISIACCNEFIVILSSTGKVYKKEFKKLSNYGLTHIFEPIKIFEGEKIVQISGTHHKCLFLTQEGKVYEYFNWTTSLSSPYKLDNYKIKAVYAGCNNFLYQTEEGKILSDGTNHSGQLLNGVVGKDASYPSDTLINEGATFCISGNECSVVFFNYVPLMSPNQNTSNEKIKQYLENLNFKDDKSSSKKSNSKEKSSSSTGSLIFGLNSDSIVSSETEKKDDKSSSKKSNSTKDKSSEKSSKSHVSRDKTESADSKVQNNKEKKKKNYEKSLSDMDSEIASLEAENSRLQKEVKTLKKQVKNSKDQPNENKPKSLNNLDILDNKSIDDLNVIKTVGRGAQSEVFEVTRDEQFALKVLLIDGGKKGSNSESSKKLQRLHQEYQILHMLNHKNIIRTFGFCFGDKKHAPSILLEFCPKNLAEAIDSMTDVEKVCCIMEISLAMEAVHAANLIHRDLKPENILIDKKGHVKVSDFGISCYVDVENQTQSKTAGVGTLKFMAPELLNESTHYNNKVDVYSFGVVVFFILTKKLPKISVIDQGNGIKASIPKNVNKTAKSLINKCWETDANDRPSFTEIIEIIKTNKFRLIDGIESEIDEIKSFLSI